MMSFLCAVLVLCLSVTTHGFVPSPGARAFSGGLTNPPTLAKSISQIGRAPATRVAALRMATAAKDAPAKKYWEGEWVCADCGYIYDIDDCGGLYFEQQKRGFVCPQCRGPRRRFAKKVGDQVGITQDGGDAPILLFSFLGLALTVAFGFWFAQQ